MENIFNFDSVLEILNESLKQSFLCLDAPNIPPTGVIVPPCQTKSKAPLWFHYLITSEHSETEINRVFSNTRLRRDYVKLGKNFLLTFMGKKGWGSALITVGL